MNVNLSHAAVTDADCNNSITSQMAYFEKEKRLFLKILISF